MDLNQIQLSYQAEEDRLLLRLSFKDDRQRLQEIRAWLTRRFVRNFWSGMLEAMKTRVMLVQPAAAHASAIIVGMGHDASVSEIRKAGGFDTPFEPKAEDFPLGEAALLVAAAEFAIEVEQPLRINFAASAGGSFELALTETMQHGFCTLLQEAIKHAEWDMELVFPGTVAVTSGSHLLN